MKTADRGVVWTQFDKKHFDGVYWRRVHPLVKFYGQFIDTITIEQFAFSCYSQGLMDAVQWQRQTGRQLGELNYEPEYAI